MRVPRCYTSQPLKQGTLISLEEEPAHHLRQVLRLRPGNPIILFDNSGDEYAANLEQVSKQEVKALLTERLRHETETPLSIHLLIGISRGERMDLAIQKATELGVNRITPLMTNRCVVKLDEKKRRNRMTHWQRVMVSACEQSDRCRLPQLDEPLEITTALAQLKPELGLLLDLQGKQSLAHIPQPENGVSILVGPEGGLTPDEREVAIQHGFTGIRLGPRVLRTETAPLAALAAVQTLWGDFNDG
ncbi:MAG: 16S rRNA (uracil(1498)-N(3))-methyltransferase [Candidatus Thiodiazotropha weberae]|uniref:16S rRNA (uracil(1498)-N(3))-methyltransferase n=1 Tax=Candidatus Thiodiazotropha endoloripes TaxID=1818881 RepID=UPI00083CB322|nr:16S rRNA (uracil(1498)-N(3))-methyltransferase [Candidatus Thiodiazotropha endoloripes]MCG7898839.1 16S rRNA (uracil(1498)-N(3))-methyltransferase [Candidatus Thiodiazotropha weberae]MCG7915628.1 16S rRNA (uracil(1498)-N(3))-methyltransferase [Candidatus Thiodiazotropha weberae]ODB90791.1 16S rRNA (uracil(1498)-N(3))-methyltransferase [Candidatus Thiodiazotropha endoloripes]ODB94184.1 16S rRNA (uracil(1498)-N(3))-methyltransferase [Candidatus Thiodiazotropha endoloripes]